MATTIEIANLVSELVRIPSVNPLQAGPVSGLEGEAALAHFIANRAEGLGAQVTLDEVEPGRPNVYARFQGSGSETVVIDVHLDTVSVEHMTQDPFDGRIENDRIYGRGSVDTKASFAIVLSVLEELAADRNGPVPTVYLVGTIAEEAGAFLGARGFHAWATRTDLQIDRLIVAEPTLCAPVHGHKGALGLNISLHGHAAHSSKPELGCNAISAAARVIGSLDTEAARLAGSDPSTEVGPGTMAVTTVGGGLAQNIIPDRCEVHANRRIAPGEDPETVFAELSALIRSSAKPCTADVSMAGGLSFAAFYQEPDGPLINELCHLAGTNPETATYGTNALSYPDLASETVIFGPGSIDQAHQAVEWIDISEIEKAANTYRSLLGQG